MFFDLIVEKLQGRLVGISRMMTSVEGSGLQ